MEPIFVEIIRGFYNARWYSKDECRTIRWKLESWAACERLAKNMETQAVLVTH